MLLLYPAGEYANATSDGRFGGDAPSEHLAGLKHNIGTKTVRASP